MQKPQVLFLVKDTEGHTRSCNDIADVLPRERYWGLALLQQHPAICVTPWFLRAQWMPVLHNLADHLIPTPRVFWSRVSRSLSAKLAFAQRRYDIAFSMHNGATASLLALRQKGVFHRPIIALLIGVADWLLQASLQERDHTLAYLAQADRLLAFGMAEVDFLQQSGLAQTKFLPFGVDVDYWSPTLEPVEDYVFAVGSDSCRDFDTLIDSCPYKLRIMTRARHLISVPVPSTTSYVHGTIADLRRLYARARVIVVPLKDRLQPSGQNTVLQAMAMGKVVVVTKTQGTWTDKLRNAGNCIYVKPNDRAAMSAAIRYAYQTSVVTTMGQEARKTVQEHFRVQNLVDAIAANVQEVVGNWAPR